MIKPEYILIDACAMVDRCNPNPCEHGGVCTQTSREFSCDCRDTGYTGAVCHACELKLKTVTGRWCNSGQDKLLVTMVTVGDCLYRSWRTKAG